MATRTKISSPEMVQNRHYFLTKHAGTLELVSKELNHFGVIAGLKSVNLQFNTVERRDDNMIVPSSDGPMIIWIDWE